MRVNISLLAASLGLMVGGCMATGSGGAMPFAGMVPGMAQSEDQSADLSTATAQELAVIAQARVKFESMGVPLDSEFDSSVLANMRKAGGASVYQSIIGGGAGAFAGLPSMNNPDAMGGQVASIAALGSGQRHEQAAKVEPTYLQEQDLVSQFESLGQARPITSFNVLKDGLEYEGRRYADPDGRAQNFAVDADTGTVAYMVKTRGSSGVVKIARLSGGQMSIGQFKVSPGLLEFTSATGKILRGDTLIPLTDGAMVLRDSVAFRYEIGKGVSQVDVPTGWTITPMQRGNVSTTGVLLIERNVDAPAKESDGFFGSLMETSGLNKVTSRAKALIGQDTLDYALLNTRTGQKFYLNFSAYSKVAITDVSGCERQNSYLNKCKNAKMEEALYDYQGFKNIGHYYWKVDWQVSNGVPVAVVHENSVKSVNALNLQTGKRVNLFDRTLGIASMDSFINAQGKLGVAAQVGFTKERVEDVYLALNERPALPELKPSE